MIWYIRILHGPDAGKVYPLQEGVHFIGRSTECSIALHDQGVSKRHAQVEVYSNKIIITDLKSRNGTFLNGTKVNTALIQPGDRASVHDTFFEVMQMPETWGQQLHQSASRASYHGNAAMDLNVSDHAMPHGSANENPQSGRVQMLYQQANQQLNEVLVPSILKFVNTMEFRWAIAMFIVIYAVLITAVSTMPFIRVLKSSAIYESEQHALTIATVLAKINRGAIAQGMDSALNVDIAMRRPGVKKAFIINSTDGNVMAPSNAVGTYPDLPYMHEARRISTESVRLVDDSTVVAAVPIDFFNSETGSTVVTAHAIVFYDIKAQMTESGRLISLFVTTLLLALFIGAGIYYLLMKVIEQPLYQLNKQLDSALKDGERNIELDVQFPIMQTIKDNLNSALSRLQSVDTPKVVAYEVDRGQECIQLTSLCGFPAMGIMLHDQSIAAINEEFEKITGVGNNQMLHQAYMNIHDQALRLSIKDLLERIQLNPTDIATNEIEFGGSPFQLAAKAVAGSDSPAYCLFFLFSRGGDS